MALMDEVKLICEAMRKADPIDSAASRDELARLVHVGPIRLRNPEVSSAVSAGKKAANG